MAQCSDICTRPPVTVKVTTDRCGIIPPKPAQRFQLCAMQSAGDREGTQWRCWPIRPRLHPTALTGHVQDISLRTSTLPDIPRQPLLKRKKLETLT